MWLPDNGANHRERAVLNRCSQAMLGAPVDENAATWTNSVQDSFVGLDRVPVPTGMVIRVRILLPDLLRAGALQTSTPKTVPSHSVARSSSPLNVDAQCDRGCLVGRVWFGACFRDYSLLQEFDAGRVVLRYDSTSAYQINQVSGLKVDFVGFICTYALAPSVVRCWCAVRGAFNCCRSCVVF